MIVAIAISIPPEDNATISIDTHLALLLQLLEEENVQNFEEKEQMITRDGGISTMIQWQEEDKAQKSMEK